MGGRGLTEDHLRHMSDPDLDLIDRLRDLARAEHDDLSVAGEGAERLKEMREALIQIDRVISMCRTWGGMGWMYLQAPPFRVEKIHRLCREALDREEPADAPESRNSTHQGKGEGDER